MVDTEEVPRVLASTVIELSHQPLGNPVGRIDSPALDALTNALRDVLARPPDTSEGYSLAVIKDQQIHYPSSPSEAQDLSLIGTTVLQNLERKHALFEAIRQRLTDATHPRVSISAFVSRPNSERLGRHVDMWDNLVVQIRGRKEFVLDDGTRRLEAGDLLYIREAVSHDVRTLDDSVHLSLVMLRSGSR